MPVEKQSRVWQLVLATTRKGSYQLHACQPADQNPNAKYEECTVFQAAPRRHLRCGHGGRADGELEVLPNAQRLRYLSRPKEYIKKVIKIRDKAATCAMIRGAVAHIPSKKVVHVTVVDKDNRALLVQRLWKKRYLARVNSMRDRSSTNKVATHSKTRIPGPPKERKLRRGRMTSSRFPQYGKANDHNQKAVIRGVSGRIGNTKETRKYI